jgi:hypothetical protein
MSPITRRILSTTWILSLVVVACSGSAPAPTAGPSTSVHTAPSPSVAPRATAAPTPAERAPDAWLVVGRHGADGTQVVIASTGGVEYELPDGVPNKTWSRLVGASTDGATTLVRNLVVQPGFGGESLTVPGAWRLPTIGSDPAAVGVSEDGKTIVLVEDGAVTSASAPTTSRFAIVRASLDAAPRIVQLTGEFEYDALAPDGSILYVVEHLAGPPDGHYQVRMIDVASGKLLPEVVADKTADSEAMAGYPIAQLREPGGMVFTLYRGPEHPFIHALQSAEHWAVCIDLPAVGAADDAAALDWGMGAAPSGSSIFAVNATLGLAVSVSTRELSIVQSASFAPTASTAIELAKFGHGAAGNVGRRVVVAPRGGLLYAAGATGVVRLSTGDLAVSGRLLEGTRTEALAITPDGGTLYALTSDGRIVGVDTSTGETRREVPGSTFDRLLGVVPFS